MSRAYNSGMKAKRQPTDILTPFTYGGIGFLVLLVAANPWATLLALAFFSPIFGAWFVYAIVRRVNRRDDPNRMKLPPDN